MMIFKKAIARRTFLRGIGTTLALPLLDSMTPAFAGPADKATKPSRLSVVYVPNGIIMKNWTPATEGTNFEIPATLEPVKPFRDQILLVSGLSNHAAVPPKGQRPAGPHASASGAFLTGVYPKPPAQAGISLDQIAAKELGRDTQLASLELTLDLGEQGAGADAADTDAYLNTMSWRSATTPLPVENNPRKVFERLFGADTSTDPAARRRRIEQDRSVLDSVTEEVQRLVAGLGPSDRGKLSEYLDGIRDVEHRIRKTEENASRETLVLDRPAGIPATYDEHAHLMADLQVLAFQGDMTRVTTFLMAREKSERAYREIGLQEGHHALSHHDGNPVMVSKVERIDLYHTKLFSYFLQKLRSTPDGDGTLLDHSLVLYGSSLSDGSHHNPTNLPLLLVGGTKFKGRHIKVSNGPPVTNMYLAMLDLLGIPVEHFGDSTGELDLLSVA